MNPRARLHYNDPMRRHALHLLLLAAAIVVGMASPARAHVEIDPAEAVAGSTVTIAFTFHHGGDGGAPTTGLDVQIPEGVTVVEVPAVEGWTSSVDEEEGIVRWTGGSVPDGTEGRFPLVVQLPDTPGDILFPAVQVTESGELAWISEEGGGSEEANPAPRLTLVADPAGTTTTTLPVTSTTRDLPDTALEAEARDDGGSSVAPWLIGAGVVALAAIAIGGTLLARRAG